MSFGKAQLFRQVLILWPEGGQWKCVGIDGKGVCEHNLHLRIPSPHPDRPDFFKKKAVGRPFFENPDGWDVGMEFGDVGCVRISFAINSKPFAANSQ